MSGAALIALSLFAGTPPVLMRVPLLLPRLRIRSHSLIRRLCCYRSPARARSCSASALAPLPSHLFASPLRTAPLLLRRRPAPAPAGWGSRFWVPSTRCGTPALLTLRRSIRRCCCERIRGAVAALLFFFCVSTLGGAFAPARPRRPVLGPGERERTVLGQAVKPRSEAEGKGSEATA
jgi:hypothetical protein